MVFVLVAVKALITHEIVHNMELILKPKYICSMLLIFSPAPFFLLCLELLSLILFKLHPRGLTEVGHGISVAVVLPSPFYHHLLS